MKILVYNELNCLDKVKAVRPRSFILATGDILLHNFILRDNKGESSKKYDL